jgi:hypothetical protein
MKFNITYEIVTPESAMDGEAADIGLEAEDLTLSEAYSVLRYEPVEHVSLFGDGSGSIYFQSYCADFGTGEEKTLALHWDKCSKYSQKRIAGLFDD